MPRGYIRLRSQTSRLRTYFGIEQEELAMYLGVSRAMVSHLDAGQKLPSLRLAEQLAPLLLHVPAGLLAQVIELPAAAAEPVPATPAPAAAPLEARLDDCTHTAWMLRLRLRRLVRKGRYVARWQAALPALLAALPPADTPELDSGLDYRWARHWFNMRARPLTPTEIAEWHLLRVRADALEAEAAALTVIIAAGTTPEPT